MYSCCRSDCYAVGLTFAAAFAGMAESYAFLWVHAGYQWAPMVAAAEDAALEALRIDPVSSDGHRSLGVVRIARNEFQAARNASHQTLQLDPSDARARHWLAVVDAALEGDTGKVTRYQARFAGVVFPGETIVTSLWKEGDKILVNAKTKERDTPVISNCAIMIRS